MRNKARFEYVDEFRKINCLQKLLPIQNLYPDDEEDAKQDNNKFIRYRQQLILEDSPMRQEYFYNNIINSYKEDIEPQCANIFTNFNDKISSEIDYYQNWSESLNHEIKGRDYNHKFVFQKANPPPREKKEQNLTKEKFINSANNNNGDLVSEKAQNNQQDTNIDLPQRSKYNFHEITRQIFKNSGQNDDKDSNFLRDLTIKHQIGQLRRLKNLQQIDKVGEFYEEYSKFNYYIQPPPNYVEIDYVDNSIVRGNNTLAIEYFRDIGTPSRKILQYTIGKEKVMMNKIEEDGTQLHSDYKLENRELLYLYFLKEQQLKINKNQLTFFDLQNISMGRITPNNSNMCVRNQKVTRSQYTKLLKKMEKYDMHENETGKPKNDKQVGTEQLQELNMNSKGQAEQQDREGNANIQQIIDEINKIRKQVKIIQQKQSSIEFNKSNFNNQIYLKLEKLLGYLYDLVTDKLSHKYPLSQIGKHLHQIHGTNEIGYDRLRVLWFIANTYDQMLIKQSKKVDLRNIIHSNYEGQPQITKYKGNKTLFKQKIQTKKIYDYYDNLQKKKLAAQKANKSKSPINTKNRTPVKTNMNKSVLMTPTKGPSNNTATKANNSLQQQTTTKKYPLTAKK